MKQLKVILLFAVLMGMTGSKVLASPSSAIEFVDANGNIVEDGSVITVSEMNEEGQMVVPLFVKNTSDQKAAVALYEIIDGMPHGEWQTCAFGNCMILSETGYSSKNIVPADYHASIQTEWIPEAGSYATWEATLQVHVFNIVSKSQFGQLIEQAGNEIIDYGPTVTVRFEYEDPSNIKIDGIYYNLIPKGKVAEVIASPYRYSGDIVIPEKILYKDVYYDVTSIGGNAFANCGSLTSITIPKSIGSVEIGAFQNCSKLSAVKIHDLVAWCNIVFKGFAASPLQYAHRLYLNDEEVVDLVIPKEVTTIRNDAFKGCTSITSVTIPSTVTDIGYESFYECTNLTTATIGDNESAEASTKMDRRVFYVCYKLESVSIGNNVKEIGGDAFYSCVSLPTITIPNSVTSIGSLAFYGCTSLTSVKLSENITSIMGGTFNNCTSLESITIPNRVETIGDSVFDGCTSLTSVSLPDNLTDLGRCTFQNCTALTSISIPDNVNAVKLGAFYGCKNLTEVTLGRGIDDMAVGSFAYCSQLTDVYCYAAKAPVCHSEYTGYYGRGVPTFEGSYIEYANLHVPESAIDNYKSASPWNTFKEMVTMKDVDIDEDDGTVTDISTLDNVIYIEPMVARTASPATVSFKMKNSAAIRGFQFDLYLPEGVTVVKSQKGKIQGALSAGRRPADDEHTLTLSEQPDGAVRFLCSSQYDETFTGTDGEIATLLVSVAEDMEEGDYTIKLKNVMLTETDISHYYTTDLVKSRLTVMPYVVGDVNGDGKVDVSDYIGVANHILGNTPEGFSAKAADVNEDGNIDVLDYTGIANIILYGSPYGK